MSEKRFLGCMFIEGIILMVLGLCVLILPKLTYLSFGVMLSSAFITYGIYKLVSIFMNKGYAINILWSVFLALFLTTIGILFLFVPKVSLLWLIALTGVYFLLESISTTAFIAKIRTMFNYWGSKMLSVIITFLVGLIIVIGVPVIAFWAVATLSGIAMVVKGMSKMSLVLANRNNYHI